MKKFYKKIAKENGISLAEVKRDMQEAIDAAYANPTFHANCVPRKGAVPTTDEFIEYCAKRILLLHPELIEKQ